MTHKIVLLRHGESTWNRENRFTGWTDVDLSDRGREEAREAGRLMKAEGYGKGYAYVFDDPAAAARMPCLPPSLAGRVYYRGPGAKKP